MRFYIMGVSPVHDFSVTVEQRRPFTIVRAWGELDFATQQKFRDAVDKAVTSPDAWLLFDLTDVGFIDSSGISVITDVHARLGQSGRVAICGLSPRNQRIFDLMGITGRVATYPTLRDALAYDAE